MLVALVTVAGHSALALGEATVDSPPPSTAQRNEFYEAYLVVAENDPY